MRGVYAAVLLLTGCGSVSSPAPRNEEPPSAVPSEEAEAQTSAVAAPSGPSVGSPAWWRTCTVGERRTVPWSSEAGRDVTVSWSRAGGLVAWVAGRHEIAVSPLADGVMGAPIRLNVTGAWRGAALASGPVDGGHVLVAHGRCGTESCLYGFAFDERGQPRGEGQTETLGTAEQMRLTALPAEQQAAGALWLRREFNSGSRAVAHELHAITIRAGRVHFERALRGVRSRRPIGTEFARTTASIFHAGPSADGLTGWQADTAEGRVVRGRTLYLGDGGGEIQGLGRRVHDLVVADGRAHLLVEREPDVFEHVVATVSGRQDAEVSSRAPVGPDALPAPFVNRARWRVEDGELRVRDALGRPVREPMAVSADRLHWTDDGPVLTRATEDGLVLTPLACSGG